MKATPVQLIAAGLVANAGAATYSCTYGTTAAPVRTGAGVVEITLDEAADAVAPGNACKVTPNTNAAIHATVTQTSDLVFVVRTFNDAGAPTDANFYFEITQLPTTKQ